MYGGRESVFSIATHYVLDGQSEIRSPVQARFSAPVQTGPEVHLASSTMDTGSFPGLKGPGHDIGHWPPSSVVVKHG